MNILDLGILATFLYNAFVGIKRGLVRSVFDLLAMFGGVFCAIIYYKQFGSSIYQLIKIPEPVCYFFSFILIWIVIFALFSLLGIVLHRLLNIILLGAVDSIGGFLFGLFKGFCFLLPFLIPMVNFHFAPLNESMVGKKLIPSVKWIIKNFLPENGMMEIKFSGKPSLFNKKNNEPINQLPVSAAQVNSIMDKMMTDEQKQMQGGIKNAYAERLQKLKNIENMDLNNLDSKDFEKMQAELNNDSNPEIQELLKSIKKNEVTE